MAGRALGNIETALHLTGAFAPMAVAGVVRLRQAPTVTALRHALKVLQTRHPLLRARIEPGRHPAFQLLDPAPPIPLAVRNRHGDDDWLEVVAEALNTGLDTATGPLMAATYLVDTDHPGEADLVLTYDHTVLDATSATHAHAELLATCGDGAGNPPPASDQIPPPLDDLVPDRLRGIDRVRPLARFTAAQTADELAYQVRAGGEPMPIHEQARNVPLTRTLDANTTTSLVRAARQRRLTTNSVVQAALLRAAATRLDLSEPRPLRVIGFADVRPSLTPPPPPEMLGCYMSMLRTTVPVAPTDDVWALAAAYQGGLRAAIAADAPLLAAGMAPMMMRAILATKRMRMATTAVSYAGPLPVPAQVGGIEITGVHGFISNNRLGPYATAFAHMLHDRLTYDFVLLDSDLPGPAADELADDTLALLTSAAGASGDSRS